MMLKGNEEIKEMRMFNWKKAKKITLSAYGKYFLIVHLDN